MKNGHVPVYKVLLLSSDNLFIGKRKGEKIIHCMVKKEKENKTVSINLG